VISKEAREYWGFKRMSARLVMSSGVCLKMKTLGKCDNLFIVLLNNLASFSAGDLCQLTTGRMDWSCLWNFY
jgi:hypothetical protein